VYGRDFKEMTKKKVVKKLTKVDNCKKIKIKLSKLEKKWAKDMKSKYNAGGNSGDNQMMALLRIAIRSCP